MSEEKEHTEHFEEGDEKPPAGVEWMATFRWMLLISFGALAFFMVARELGVASSGKFSKEQRQSYTCPMHPQIVRDEPGLCPICSMDLVAVQSQSDSMPSDSMPSDSQPSEPTSKQTPPGLSSLMLSPERIQKIGLTTTKVRLHSFANTQELVGTIAADESRLVQVHSRVGGFIEYLKPLRVGDAVKKGELLATVYSTEIDEAEREYLLLRGSSLGNHGGAALAEAAKERLKTFKISDAEIAAVEKAGKPLPLSIIAPAKGVITEKNAIRGANVMPDEPLFQIVDLDVVFALVELSERDLAGVTIGQRLTITSASYADKLFEGEVSLLYPSIDESTRTRKVRVELQNPERLLVPGMFIRVQLSKETAERLAIPRDALIETGKRSYIFLAEGDGRFTPVEVKVGVRDEGFVEIIEGLSEGETIVLAAGFLLDAESRLQGGR